MSKGLSKKFKFLAPKGLKSLWGVSLFSITEGFRDKVILLQP